MDSHYYTHVRNQAVEQFPHLVDILGYERAVEELEYAMSRELRDHMLFEDETRLIGMVAIENYWLNQHIPDNIIRGTE